LETRRLLILGRDLNQLIRLCVGLQGCFPITTVVETDDIVGAAKWSASQAPRQIIVCSKGDMTETVLALREISPRVLFLVTDGTSAQEKLKAAGALVLAEGESPAVIHATLFAYEGGQIPTSNMNE